MAEKPTDGLFKRLGRGFDRYVGGLLGEDLEGMSPEEKAAARRSIIGVIGRGMVDPSQGSEALGAVTQARAQRRAQGELERRTAAAEAEMPRIAGRLFGGTAGALESLPGISGEGGQLTASYRPSMLESLPGEGGEGGQLTARYRPRTLESLPGISGQGGPLTSRYRRDPMDAMSMLYRSQAGRDAAKLAPDLATLAAESVKPSQPSLTNDQREYLTAKDQGYPGTFMEYLIAVKGASAPSISLSTGQRGENKAQDTLAANEANAINEDRNRARGAVRVWTGAQKLIDLSGTGALSGALAPGIMGANNFLVSIFGIGVDPKNMADAAQFNAAVSQLVIDQMSTLGGARGFSKEETALLQQSFPNIATSTQARIAIARLLQAKAEDSINSYNENLNDFKAAFPNLRTSYRQIDLPKITSGTRPAGVSADEWAAMTPEERALFR